MAGQDQCARRVKPCQWGRAGGGGGGTHTGFGYPLQNSPRELWLSTRSRPEKGGAVTDPSTLRRGLLEGA